MPSWKGKPLPVVDRDSEPYWTAARERRLSLPQCDACGHFVFYPRPVCPSCHSRALTWRDVSGKGVVYTYTIVRIPISEAFQEAVPYVVALIDTAEGARIMTNIVNCDVEGVFIGLAVRVTFEVVTEDITLVQFEPDPDLAEEI